MTKISVIVPVYNMEQYLERCLKSIIDQEHNDLEIIVVNDGSKDSSATIIKNYAKTDKRIIFIDKENEGVSKTRNIGIALATGKYIAFVDPDDYLDKEMYKLLLEKIEEEQSDIVFCRYKYVSNDEKTVHFCNEINLSELVESPRSIHFFLIQKGSQHLNSGVVNSTIIMGSIWRSLFKRDIINDNGLTFNPLLFYAEDLIFMLQYLRCCNKASLVDKYLYNYFFSMESASRKKYKDNYIDNIKEVTKQKLSAIEFNENYSPKELKTMRAIINLGACGLIVRNELGRDDFLKSIKKISKDKYLKSLIPLYAFPIATKNGVRLKKILFYVLIKLHAWQMIKYFFSKEKM